MAENSAIEWTKHTFNPWIGCTKVSPACDHCYAEAWDKRFGGERWGPRAARRRTKTWGNPVKWNRQAEASGERPRVFCASLADVFDNHKSIEQSWRNELWALIDSTPNLDWLLLTKRPQNIARYMPSCPIGRDNVWLGITVENREEMLRRSPHLAEHRPYVAGTFWSAEPLLGDIGDIPSAFMPSWVITGGESGPKYRPANPDWFRSLRDQCASADVPFLFKQWEGKSQREIKAKGRELDGVVHDGYPMIATLERVCDA